ncbi:class II fructose-bisphosphate aldolase [Granulosicoccus antarcticus]|uniref:Fructose-bisphosphate aldolase n=1 Tax=Granulosicoccus antarcticus IMCC3135 TaxID=1192854 RepID=A0A2Z2NZX0_9GAMM|nr:class II fructose-bisphosphate aldolase [Granulosicoccus antarcticus]ASJ76813.1 Fructose-bisphosphate aldolase [Granulosicoccus antarcticus IMCC3135]
MALQTGLEILQAAQAGKYGVGAFNTDNLETTLAIMEAAEETRSPILLAITAGALKYSSKRIVDIALAEARNATVPVAVHLDHGESFEICMWCIRNGFTSIMIDKSHEDEATNIRETRRVVDAASAVGVSVEAEIGRLVELGAEVIISEENATLTTAEEAERFMAAAGADTLAIAVGTAHGPNKGRGRPEINHKRIAEIAARVSQPLVMHGASSIPQDVVARVIDAGGVLKDAVGIHDDDITQAIASGMCKVNVGTDLRIASTAGVRELLRDKPEIIDLRKILEPARNEMRRVIINKMNLLQSSGKA